MEWNPLAAGRRVDPEEIRAIAPTEIPECERKRLTGWYEPVVSQLSLPLGRLICQRTNIVYDMRTRKKYSGLLLGAAVVLTVGLVLLGLYHEFKVNDFILTLLLPALPFVAFVLREHRKQSDTIDTLTTLKAEVEKLWDKALAGMSPDELTVNSRALQDAIYRHRTSNPLVFDWLYNWFWLMEEDLTCHAAAKLVTEAKNKLNTPEEK